MSERGHFCLLPKDTKPLDVVFIPHGGKVPLVLRPTEQYGAIDYGLVGECYVHGAMFGDAMAWDDIEEVTFRMR